MRRGRLFTVIDKLARLLLIPVSSSHGNTGHENFVFLSSFIRIDWVRDGSHLAFGVLWPQKLDHTGVRSYFIPPYHGRNRLEKGGVY